MLRPGSVLLGLLVLVAALRLADSNRCLTMLEGKAVAGHYQRPAAQSRRRVCQRDIARYRGKKRRRAAAVNYQRRSGGILRINRIAARPRENNRLQSLTSN